MAEPQPLQPASRWETPDLVAGAVALLALLVYSRTMMYHLLPPGMEGARTARLVIYFAVYGATGLLVLSNWRVVLQAMLREKFVLLLLALAAISSLWSQVPGTSLEKTVGVTACALFGACLALRFTWRRQLQLLAAVFALAMTASLAAAVLLPDMGIMQGLHEGIWRGAFGHKNILGKMLCVSGAVFFALALQPGARRGWCLAGFWISLALLAMACSKASLLSWMLLFLALGVYLLATGRRRLAITALVSVALALGSFTLQRQFKLLPPIIVAEVSDCVARKADDGSHHCDLLASILASAPDSVDLNTGEGRLELWGHLAVKIAERPVLGYGLGAFWLGMDGPSAYVWEREPWHPTHAHNGYVDLALHLGLLGLGLLLATLFILFLRVLPRIAAGSLDVDTLGRGAVLGAVLLANIGESSLFAANALLWVLLVATVIGLDSAGGEAA